MHHERPDADRADTHIATYDGRLSAWSSTLGRPGNWRDRVLDRLQGRESMARAPAAPRIARRFGA